MANESQRGESSKTPGEQLREFVAKIRPENCCKKKPMKTSASSEPEMLCNEHCNWSDLERVIVNILIDEGK